MKRIDYLLAVLGFLVFVLARQLRRGVRPPVRPPPR